MSSKQPGLCCILVMLMLGVAWASRSSPGIVIPRLPDRFTIDVPMDEVAWTTRAAILPIEFQTPAEVSIVSDGQALWLALRGQSLTWETLEIALRVTDCLEEQDRFLLDANGRTRLIRQRVTPIPTTDTWQAAIFQDSDRWVVKIQIPFETLGFRPAPGEVFEVGVAFHGLDGRMDANSSSRPGYLVAGDPIRRDDARGAGAQHRQCRRPGDGTGSQGRAR